MKAIILGGAGFIGLHLARRLLADGYEVTLADDFSRGRHDPDLDAVVAGGATLLTADLTSADAWARIPHGWDEIYLLAAVVGVRNVEQDPSRVIRVNTTTVLHLLDWVQPGEKVFFASTSEIYAGGVSLSLVPVPTAETVPVTIEDVTAPRFAYAISKLLGESAFVHATTSGAVDAVIGRFHNVYGPRMGADHVIPEMLLRARDGEDPFTVWGADQSRAFCYVDDAVEAVVSLMRTPAASGKIVHIGDDTGQTNIADLAKVVVRIVGVDVEFVAADAPSGSVPRRGPDLTLLRELTGYQPTVGLEEGVQRTWQWYRGFQR